MSRVTAMMTRYETLDMIMVVVVMIGEEPQLTVLLGLLLALDRAGGGGVGLILIWGVRSSVIDHGHVLHHGGVGRCGICPTRQITSLL